MSERAVDFALETEQAITKLHSQFVLTRDSPVDNLLSKHRSLAPILIDGIDQLRLRFGADAAVELRTLTDEFGSSTLYATVLWPGSVDQVRNLLEEFDNSWWLAHSSATDGRLCFTYELV